MVAPHLLSPVPEERVAQEFLWAGGKAEAQGEPQDGVDGLKEVQAAANLAFQLGREEAETALRRFGAESERRGGITSLGLLLLPGPRMASGCGFRGCLSKQEA